MKKTILFLLGLVMLGSCAYTDSLYGDLKEQNNSSMEIRFDNGFGTKRTRAIVEVPDSLVTINLGVYAKINGTSNIVLPAANEGFLIHNDTLSYADSKWTCTKRYFWPKKVSNTAEPTVDFFAYGPIEIGAATVNLADSIITIPIVSTQQDSLANDLVYGSKVKQTYDKDNGVAKGAREGYVDFNLKHQLSWISFEAKATTHFDTLQINSIQVKVDKSQANFKIETKADTAYICDTTTVHTYNFNAIDTVKFNQKDSTAYVRVADFIAIPQMVSDAMTATINYTAVIGGEKYENCEVVVKLNKGDLTETGCAAAPWTVANWKKNYKYTYRINFNWQEILFTAVVNEWNISEVGPYLIY